MSRFSTTLPPVSADSITIDEDGRVIVEDEEFARILKDRFDKDIDAAVEDPNGPSDGWFDNCDCDKNQTCK